MTNQARSPLQRYGIVFILAALVLLVTAIGFSRIQLSDPEPAPGVDRTAHEAAVSTSQSGLETVTKDNVEDTSMTVN